MISFVEKAEIVRYEQLSKDIFRLTCHSPSIAEEAAPGQFVMVRVLDSYDPLLRRPFSIHRVITADGLVQILFKVIGTGTRIMAALRSGQELDMMGPLGRGFTLNRSRRTCLVGGGMGIAPLLFLAENLLQTTPRSEIDVLLGARSKEELHLLAEDFKVMGLSVQLATDDGSIGHQGMVTDLLENLNNQASRSVYACGPYLMMRAVAKQCEKKGWNCQVSLETTMACGLAACLGCAIPKREGTGYMHVCKHGPVFKAEEVLWQQNNRI